MSWRGDDELPPGLDDYNQSTMLGARPPLPPRVVGVPVPIRTMGTWTEYRSPQGETYFFDLATGTTQWHPPAQFLSNTHPHPQIMIQPPPQMMTHTLPPNINQRTAFGHPVSALKTSVPSSSSPWRIQKTSSGGIYYHNIITNISTFDKPPDFDRPAPVSVVPEQSFSQNLPIQSVIPPQVQPPVPSRPGFMSIPPAIQDETPGGPPPRRPSRRQYYGGVPLSTSRIPKVPNSLPSYYRDLPAENQKDKRVQQNVEENDENALLPPGEFGDEENGEIVETSRKSSITPREKDPLMAVPLSGSEFLSPEEAEDAFTQLLKDKSIAVGMTWMDALPKIANDNRYKVVKSLHERKRIFESFLSQLEKLEKEAYEQKLAEMKRKYLELLQESTEINSQTRFDQVDEMYRDDPRCSKFEDVTAKKRIFHDFLDDLEARLRQEKREARIKASNEFENIVNEKVTIESNLRELTWRSFSAELAEIPEFAKIQEILEEDMEQTFLNVLRRRRDELETKEKAEREEKRKEEKRLRDDFRALLKEKLFDTANQFHTFIRWKTMLPLIESDPRYQAVIQGTVENRNTIAKKMFEEFMDYTFEKCEEERKLISRLLAQLKLDVDSEEGIASSDAALLLAQLDEFKKIPDEVAQVVLRDVIEEAREKRKKHQRLVEKLQALLEEKVTSADTTWDKVVPQIAREECFLKLNEDDHVRLFVQRIEQLRALSGDSQEDSDEEGALSESEYTVKDKFLQIQASHKRVRSHSKSRSPSRSRSRSRKRFKSD